ncbi:MAG: acyltransferase domain-containing protein [Sporichthyaceae bacterium]|nr:acyltransferase domain-containing protein [Sporichthyaceae bacterium]
MLVIVAPGQGAQAPGFLKSWLELPHFEDRLRWLSACAGMDLVHYGTEADAETIRDTAVAQPLLVAAGLIAALEIFPQPSDAFHAVGAAAGHSVGEITAAAGTGVISAEQALVLVRERGRAMADAAALKPTGMTAVLGGDPAEVTAVLERHGLTAANMNGAGQVVAAGTLEQLESLAGDPPAKARLMPLSVAGAFHTEHMAPAEHTLASYAKAVSVHDPRTRLISNRDGTVVQQGRDALGRIVSQVSNPVRWDLCMRTMGELGVTGVIEVPPAGTLTGLIKRSLPGVETVALKTPDDLDAARDLAARHGSAAPQDGSPSWRMLVAPTKGTVRLADLPIGTILEPGSAVVTLVSSRDEQPIVAPHGGTVVEWLVEDGDPVSPGQPLVRLHPEAVGH